MRLLQDLDCQQVPIFDSTSPSTLSLAFYVLIYAKSCFLHILLLSQVSGSELSSGKFCFCPKSRVLLALLENVSLVHISTHFLLRPTPDGSADHPSPIHSLLFYAFLCYRYFPEKV